MAELPSSWGLRTKRAGGKLKVLGKDDAGHEYTVRTCDAPYLTERDVAEIAAVDRERTTAREFVGNLVAGSKARQVSQEQQFQDELEEAAGPVVRAGFERERCSTGYSRAYARKFDAVFGGN